MMYEDASMQRVSVVLRARYFSNPVPNAVRCGVRDGCRASSVSETRYIHTYSGVPLARSVAEYGIPPRTAELYGVTRRVCFQHTDVRQVEEMQRKTLAECDALKQAMLREVFE